jgi:hypothetical protein
MTNKFLFTEEYVGEFLWNDRDKIVELYFQYDKEPFVEKGKAYTIAEFQIMIDFLRQEGRIDL